MDANSKTAFYAETYNVWLREKVNASISDQAPVIPHSEVLAVARKIIEERRSA
jgi:hypothetical protein